MPVMLYVLAAIGGWVVDDFCGTPPRPWPPGPWPWLRKILALVGGAGSVVLWHDIIGPDYGPVSIIIVGGIGGAFLASIVSMAVGNMAANAPTADVR